MSKAERTFCSFLCRALKSTLREKAALEFRFAAPKQLSSCISHLHLSRNLWVTQPCTVSFLIVRDVCFCVVHLPFLIQVLLLKQYVLRLD